MRHHATALSSGATVEALDIARLGKMFEASFIQHAEHFAAYFAGQRFEKTGKVECDTEEQ